MDHSSPEEQGDRIQDSDAAEEESREGAAPGPDPDPGFYARALRRMPRWMVLIAAVALPLVWWRGGALAASSFLTGAIGGYWNYVGVCRIADRLAQTVERTGRGPRFSFRSLLRLLFIAGAVFVIIRFTRINLAAAFLGLFTPVAAVVAEILFELGSSHRGPWGNQP